MKVKQSTTKEAIVDFLHLDTSKITFSNPKKNKYNGSQIGILYEGKTLFVKYEGYTPFGLKENFDEDGNYQGTSMQINCEDKYLEKAKELDQFFINEYHQNEWGLNKNLPIDSVKGYDEYGQGGLWKRICKKPYKINNNEREYLDYPSKMEFTLFYKGDKLQTKFFNWNKEKIEFESVLIGPRCNVKFSAAWFSLTCGTFGLTLKPKLMQVMFKEEENIFNEFILDSGDEETEPVICLNPD